MLEIIDSTPIHKTSHVYYTSLIHVIHFQEQLPCNAEMGRGQAGCILYKEGTKPVEENLYTPRLICIDISLTLWPLEIPMQIPSCGYNSHFLWWRHLDKLFVCVDISQGRCVGSLQWPLSLYAGKINNCSVSVIEWCGNAGWMIATLFNMLSRKTKLLTLHFSYMHI